MKYNIQKTLLLFVLFLCGATLSIAQEKKKEQEKAESLFLQKVLDKDLSINFPDNSYELFINTRTPFFSIVTDSIGEESIFRYSIMEHEDMNNDSIADYLVFVSFESTDQYNQKYITNMLRFFAMEDSIKYKKQTTITLSKPCGNYIIDGFNYENKKLKAMIKTSSCPHAEVMLEPERQMLTFAFDGDELYEESYRSECEVAKLSNKNIFKDKLKGDLSRKAFFNTEFFSDAITEYYVEDNIYVNTKLDGCDNLNLIFYFDIEHDEDAPKLSDKESKTKIMDALDFLAKRTHYKKIFNKIKKDYAKQVYSNSSFRKGMVDRIWQYEISNLYDDKAENEYKIVISINHLQNLNQSTDWDRIMRRK